MKVIKCLADKIQDELDDAEAYIDAAISWKTDEPGVADLFSELSEEEMGHMEKLHEKVLELIEDYRERNGDPPQGMMALYEWLHNKYTKHAMQIRVKQGMFRA